MMVVCFVGSQELGTKRVYCEGSLKDIVRRVGNHVATILCVRVHVNWKNHVLWPVGKTGCYTPEDSECLCQMLFSACSN